MSGDPPPELRPSFNFHCPVCGHLSTMVIGLTQALCTNADIENSCTVLFFNPSLPDGGLSQARAIDPDNPLDGP